MRYMLRVFLFSAVLAAATGTQAQPASYPHKVIKMLVGFPPGQGTDILARVLAERLSGALKQPIIVENRPGQGGSVALAALTKAAPDGYTIMLSSNGALVVNPHLFSDVHYDSLRDVKPVALVADLPMVVVTSKASAFQDLNSVLQFAKANPDKLNFASTGTFSQLWGSLIEQHAAVKFHLVPYPGSGPAAVDLIAGRVDFSIDTIAGVRNFVQSGEMRLLATGPDQRLRAYPNVPTINESGAPGVYAKAWLGVVAPKGTPADVVERLNREIGVVLDASVAEKFDSVGAIVRKGSAGEFSTLLTTEYAKWGAAVKAAGLKPE